MKACQPRYCFWLFFTLYRLCRTLDFWTLLKHPLLFLNPPLECLSPESEKARRVGPSGCGWWAVMIVASLTCRSHSAVLSFGPSFQSQHLWLPEILLFLEYFPFLTVILLITPMFLPWITIQVCHSLVKFCAHQLCVWEREREYLYRRWKITASNIYLLHSLK